MRRPQSDRSATCRQTRRQANLAAARVEAPRSTVPRVAPPRAGRRRNIARIVRRMYCGA
jgi:hypothetical protein